MQPCDGDTVSYFVPPDRYADGQSSPVSRQLASYGSANVDQQSGVIIVSASVCVRPIASQIIWEIATTCALELDSSLQLPHTICGPWRVNTAHAGGTGITGIVSGRGGKGSSLNWPRSSAKRKEVPARSNLLATNCFVCLDFSLAISLHTCVYSHAKQKRSFDSTNVVRAYAPLNCNNKRFCRAISQIAHDEQVTIVSSL